jgi:hypothetical protein
VGEALEERREHLRVQLLGGGVRTVDEVVLKLKATQWPLAAQSSAQSQEEGEVELRSSVPAMKELATAPQSERVGAFP